MKRAMVVLLCLISALTSVSFGFIEQARDENRLNTIEMVADAQPFYIRENNVDPQAQVKLFEQLSQKYDATFIRSGFTNQDGKSLNYKAGVYTPNFLRDWNLDLTQGKQTISGKKFVSSYRTHSKDQIGQVRDLFQDHPLRIETLAQLYQDPNMTVAGSYALIASPTVQASILKRLATAFDTTPKELVKATHGQAYSAGSLYLMALVVAFVAFTIFCLMSVFYPVSRLKEIGVMKMQGYRNLAIWRNLNRHLVIIPALFYLFSIIAQAYLVKDSGWRYFLTLTIVQAVLLLICLGISLVMVLAVRKIKLANILKNYYSFKIPLYFSYVLKFLIFFGLIFAIPLMSSQVKKLQQTSALRQAYQAEQQYLTLADFRMTETDQEALRNGEDSIDPKVINLYQYLEKHANARYILTTVRPLTLNNNKKINLPIMSSNQAQAKYFHLIPPKQIKQAYQDKNRLHYFVPQSLQKNEAELQAFLFDHGKNYLKDSGMKKVTTDKIKINYYQNSDRAVFSENAELAAKGHGFVTNPIILCFRDEFLVDGFTALQNSALQNPIRILNTKHNRQAIKTGIQRYDLVDNQLKFKNVLSSGYAEELRVQQMSLIAWAAVLIMAILISILASYYIILIILASRQKEMLVSRLLGHSLWTRYRNEIYYFVSIYLFGFFELLLLTREPTSFMIYSILVLIDAAVIYVLIRSHEKQSLGLALKGEEG